jgi:hypothetical protein
MPIERVKAEDEASSITSYRKSRVIITENKYNI